MQDIAVTTQCLAIISIIHFWRKICEYFPICGGVFHGHEFSPYFFSGGCFVVCVCEILLKFIERDALSSSIWQTDHKSYGPA